MGPSKSVPDSNTPRYINRAERPARYRRVLMGDVAAMAVIKLWPGVIPGSAEGYRSVAGEMDRPARPGEQAEKWRWAPPYARARARETFFLTSILWDENYLRVLTDRAMGRHDHLLFMFVLHGRRACPEPRTTIRRRNKKRPSSSFVDRCALRRVKMTRQGQLVIKCDDLRASVSPPQENTAQVKQRCLTPRVCHLCRSCAPCRTNAC
ncbi:hypothetical protein Bbelb_090320 [Branchiostoma belcheri]|nr:hypothetical protein Bbelb_090320 [Branchiostoma belcheri]